MIQHKQKEKTILIEIDEDSEMARVSIDNECVMEGNYWDFHPGCHGITKYGHFSDYTQLVQRIYLYLTKSSSKVIVEKKKYKYK
jgi:hypothetical protein